MLTAERRRPGIGEEGCEFCRVKLGEMAATLALRQPLKPGSELRRSLIIRRKELTAPNCCDRLALARLATDASNCDVLTWAFSKQLLACHGYCEYRAWLSTYCPPTIHRLLTCRVCGKSSRADLKSLIVRLSTMQSVTATTLVRAAIDFSPSTAPTKVASPKWSPSLIVERTCDGGGATAGG